MKIFLIIVGSYLFILCLFGFFGVAIKLVATLYFFVGILGALSRG